MRARPLTLLTALAAVTLVVVAGCEARVEAEAYSAADRISSRFGSPRAHCGAGSGTGRGVGGSERRSLCGRPPTLSSLAN